MEDAERWVALKDFEGLYLISSMGRVRSLSRTVMRRGGAVAVLQGRSLKPYEKRCGKMKGYWVVDVTRDGVQARLTLHVAVLRSFVGERPEGMQARHLNGVKARCELSNLKWGTPAEQQADKQKHGTGAMISDEVVRRVRKAVSGAAAVRQYGLSKAAVSRIRNGKSYSWVEG